MLRPQCHVVILPRSNSYLGTVLLLGEEPPRCSRLSQTLLKADKKGSSGSDVLRRFYPLNICRVNSIRMINKEINSPSWDDMVGSHSFPGEGRQKHVPMFLTTVTTLWYTKRMAIRTLQRLKHVLKSFAIFTIALGIAGLGTLTAGQTPCGPDCSMQAPKLHQLSCCTSPAGSSHVEKRVSCALQENNQAPSSACDGALCTDSSFDVREIAANTFASLDMSVVQRPAYSSETAVFHASQRSFGQPHHPATKIPVYMLTCVYLI